MAPVDRGTGSKDFYKKPEALSTPIVRNIRQAIGILVNINTFRSASGYFRLDREVFPKDCWTRKSLREAALSLSISVPRVTAPFHALSPGFPPGRACRDPGGTIMFRTFWRDIVERGGDRALATYDAWMAKSSADRRFVRVQEFVHRIDHSFLHSLRVADVERVTSHPDSRIRTEHALPGNIRWNEDWVKATARFSTPWALAFIMHGYMEKTRRIPRWSEFLAFLRGEAFNLYYGPFRDKFGYAGLEGPGRGAAEAERDRGFLYRAGTYYYSFLRELDLMTRLRCEHGLPVRYHVLADVDYRFDFWCGDVLVLIFVSSGYRAEKEGGDRGKKDPADFLDIRRFSEIRTVTPPIGRESAGRAALFTPGAIAALASDIRSKMGTGA